jgi:hypothetical protein
MALTPNIIIRAAYVRIGAWLGDSAQINAQYNSDTNFDQVVSESFPPQAMYDMLTAVENEIAKVVASNPDNVLRTTIGDTITVASGAQVPDISDGGAPVMGEWGQVRDADTGLPLTPGMHEDEIVTISNGPAGLFKSSYRSFAVRFPRIYATVANLEIDCCVFDYDQRAAAIAANQNLLFEQSSNAYFYGLMANLKNQDALYTSLSNEYVPLYAEWLKSQAPEPSNTSVAASAS